MTICGLSLLNGNLESRKNLEQKFIFQLDTICPHGINERLSFHEFIHKITSPYSSKIPPHPETNQTS